MRSSYLPALEAARVREPFSAEVPGDLSRLAPNFVIIGDSMAGRVDFKRLSEVSGGIVGPLLQFASGPAYWYLSLKNHVVPSGVKPTWVLIFFRDTNLTDVLFRLDGPYRPALDRVALDIEPELNAVVGARARGGWRGLHERVERLYLAAEVRAWLEPKLSRWPARMVAGPQGQDRLLERVNDAFSLDRLRPMAQADLAATDAREADFGARLETSTLPLMMALSRQHGLRLGFVRVMRRPVDGRPPRPSLELQAYMRDLRSYLESHGGALFDDNDYAELAQLTYDDGDHLARESSIAYTDHLWERLRGATP